MARTNGVRGLLLGLVLAALVVVGLYTVLLGAMIDAGPIDNEPSAEDADEADADWTGLELFGGVLTLVGLAHVVVIPVSMNADTKYVGREADWQPRRDVWVPLSLVPGVQLAVAAAYLARRTYRLTLRPRLIGRRATSGGEPAETDATGSSAEGQAPESAAPTSVLGRAVHALEFGFDALLSVGLSYFLSIGPIYALGQVLGGTAKAVLFPVMLVLWFVLCRRIWAWRRR
ncbi:hypothetical protein [Halostella litorea]|uniref:hypothetical protein n=1 Tax=Halostella litorea TaxID=2528831 RepID=UPI0010919896|nr:hypothetical protein [Halostella litorea]